MSSKNSHDTVSLISNSDEEYETECKEKIVKHGHGSRTQNESNTKSSLLPSMLSPKRLKKQLTSTLPESESASPPYNCSNSQQTVVPNTQLSSSVPEATNSFSEGYHEVHNLGTSSTSSAAQSAPITQGEENLPEASSTFTFNTAGMSYTVASVQATTPDSETDGVQQPTSEAVWQMNYHEASIYLQEGADNDKFDSHPGKRSALPAYLLTHSTWFYSLDLLASLILLSLAVAERPALILFQGMSEGIHATVELFALGVLGISIILQLKWLGWRKFVRHKRSMLKSTAWLVMVAEAITVIIRNSSHFRATRALRPIFLLDNRYLGGVRRFMRQLLQSVPPILEVFAILLLVLTVFSTLGFYLFGPHPEDPYFKSMPDSIVSLFVLLTTANYPDVMMPAYARDRANAAFFILYLAVTLYCLMNFIIAILFVVFSEMEKDKFRKLLLHKRRACQLAFRLLVTRAAPTKLSFANFSGLLKFFRPKAKLRDVYLSFKALNKSGSGSLSLSEFYQVYTACGLSWQPSRPLPAWYTHLPPPGPKIGAAVRGMVTHPAWEVLVYLVICSNGIALLVFTMMLSAEGSVAHPPEITWYQLAFVAFYSVEVLLKVIGLGVSAYLSSGWNVFDFVVTVLSIAGLLAESFGAKLNYIAILRPLRLLRLFRIRKRYREVMDTLSLLAPRVLYACVVICVIYYFFAIIGMEIFSTVDLRNCCVDSMVEQYYRADNSSRYQNYYYLNNFGDIFTAGVTLFELTVVNNWFIIMEGYAFVSGDWTRLFFMLFYIVMMLVMSVVVAFIIEAFTFKMHYNQTVNRNRTRPKSEVTRVFVSLVSDELEFVYRDCKDTRQLLQYSHDRDTLQELSEGSVLYIGIGRRSKSALQMRMYRHLLHTWIREASSHDGDGSDGHNHESARSSHGHGGARGSSARHGSDVHRRRNRSGGREERDGRREHRRSEREDTRRTQLAAVAGNERTDGADTTAATRVTIGGVTEMVGGGGRRRRTSSIASNLMEWWRAETEGDGDENDSEVEAENDAIWGLDEDEVMQPMAPTNIIVNNTNVAVDSCLFTSNLASDSNGSNDNNMRLSRSCYFGNEGRVADVRLPSLQLSVQSPPAVALTCSLPTTPSRYQGSSQLTASPGPPSHLDSTRVNTSTPAVDSRGDSRVNTGDATSSLAVPDIAFSCSAGKSFPPGDR